MPSGYIELPIQSPLAEAVLAESGHSGLAGHRVAIEVSTGDAVVLDDSDNIVERYILAVSDA